MLRKIIALIGLPILVLAAFYLSQFVVSFAILGLFGQSQISLWQAQNSLLFNLIVSAITYLVVLVIVSLLPIKLLFDKNDTNPIDETRKKDLLLSILLAVAGFIAYYLLSMALTAIFSNFSWFNIGQEQEVIYKTAGDQMGIIISGLALVVVAPYFEEAIFRGWLYGTLRKIRVGGILAALVTSVAFGFLHGQWNVGVDTFALSLVSCYLYEQTGSIRSSVFLHMIKNGLAFYVIFFT
ncbi:MAG: CPBP family intramembrane metalloprotease [Candidatus Nomurabacteria bacterium]|jgi:membrane protease YdiL (CAAX protease family)|nr:CPBP family intramembrane metalloprotease [Candidatus Nomurabacteria bacterium]